MSNYPQKPRPCRWCGETTTYPDALCSGYCREEYYGESSAERYENERHPFEETEEETEEADED